MKTRLLLPLCLLALPVHAQDEAPPEKLTLDKYLDWEWAGGPQVSPDGAEVVWVRSWVDKVEDRRRSALWIMDADGGRPRHLTEGGSPVWSPSGARILFARGGQLHVMYAGSREVTQITRVDEAPSSFGWSPDGARVAFSMLVPEKDSPVKIQLPERPKGAEWAPEPKVVSRLSYRRDHSGFRPKGFRHLFVVDAHGGTPRQVTEGDYDHGGPQWSADGEELFFSGLRVEDADWKIGQSDVYAVHVRSGAVRQLTTRDGPERGPLPSPNGELVAYTRSDWEGATYHQSSLWITDPQGTFHRSLTADLDRSPRSVTWAADSSALYFTAQDQGATHLYRVDLAGSVQRLTEGAVNFGLSSLARDGCAYGTLSTAHEPGDVVCFRPRLDGRPAFEQLTKVNDDLLEHVALGEVEEIRYRSTDDLEIQGWIVKPPDFDPTRKYPLILQIHGGPHSMYRSSFSFELQNHAANGYVCLYTNPRGSTGYGEAFAREIQNAYPGKDYDDLMNGVDEVISRGYVDEDNLFVYGGSGGGVLTCWCVGMTGRFTAAVSMFPVTDWISFVGTTDGPYWYHNFERYPWEDITEHWERSPLRLVGNVTTPTMLLTGELDLRTPMAQTEEYYQALRMRKVPSVMVRVADEYHGAAGRHWSNALRRILYVRGWFEKYGTHKGEPEVEGE